MIDHVIALAALVLIVAAAVWPDPQPTPATGPACPSCGGGPLVDMPGQQQTYTVCQSCARVVTPRRPT